MVTRIGIVRPLIAARLLVAAAAFLAGPARGADYTWEVSGGNWDVEANWDPDGAPWTNESYVADVNSGTIKASRSVEFMCRLNLNSGTTLALTNWSDTTPTVATNLHVNTAKLDNQTAAGPVCLGGVLTLDGPLTVTNSGSGSNRGHDVYLRSQLSGSETITVNLSSSAWGLKLYGDNTNFTGTFDLKCGILFPFHTNALGGAGAPKLVIPDGCTLGTGSGWALDQEVEVQPGGIVSVSGASSNMYSNLHFTGTSAKPCKLNNDVGGTAKPNGKIHQDGDLVVYTPMGHWFYIYAEIYGSGSTVLSNGYYYLYNTNQNYTGNFTILTNTTLLPSTLITQGGTGTGGLEIRMGGTNLIGNKITWTNLNSSVWGDGRIEVRKTWDDCARGNMVFEGATTIYPGGTNTAGTNLLIDAKDIRLGTASSSASLSIDLAGSASGQYDTLRIDDGNDTAGEILYLDGHVELALNFVDDFVPTGEETFTIVNNMDDASRTVNGRFSNDDGAGHLEGERWIADVAYDGGDGNDIVLSNVRLKTSGGTMIMFQ